MPHQPFRDEAGDRRRSTLLFFHVGVLFSVLAVVVAEKLQSFRTPLLALAVVGAGVAILCLLRFLRSNDEREQQINYHALTFAFTGTLVFSAAIGFLQAFGLATVHQRQRGSISIRRKWADCLLPFPNLVVLSCSLRF